MKKSYFCRDKGRRASVVLLTLDYGAAGPRITQKVTLSETSNNASAYEL